MLPPAALCTCTLHMCSEEGRLRGGGGPAARPSPISRFTGLASGRRRSEPGWHEERHREVESQGKGTPTS